MFGRTTQVIHQARDYSIQILGWVSLALAAIGGAYAAESWIGDTVETVVGFGPWNWLPNLLLAVALLATFIDLIADLTPNFPALGSFILAPSIATAADGGIATWVTERSNDLQQGIGGDIAGWVGSASATALALVCIVSALLIGRRVLRKQNMGMGRGGPR